MIEARTFVDAARARGFEWYAGVPCSFLTPFINYVINDPTLHYVSAANEGDALAIATGLGIGGRRAITMMQNSGLGNAVSPLTSLTHVFRIPALVICTHRGAPGVHDEPQHALMGPITPAMFDVMQIPWRDFPGDDGAVAGALDAADASLQSERRAFALLMAKGSVAPHPLRAECLPTRRRTAVGPAPAWRPPAARPARHELLARIQRLTPENRTVVIASTGYTGRELFALADRANQLYMVGSMGCAASLGLGLALARPDRRIVVVDGDGAALMRMGNFATIGSYGGANLTHIVLDNEVHDSTGGQATVSANVDFAGVAAACGYASVASGDRVELIDQVLGDTDMPGPRLLHLKIRPGTLENLPRPTMAPDAVAARLVRHLRETP